MAISPKVFEELLRRKKELESSIAKNKKELQEITSALNSLAGSEQTPTRYNWTSEAIECIKSKNRFLLTNEILECLLYGSEDLKDEKKKRNATVGLSVALNKLCARGRLRKIVVDGQKGHFYGLPDWFNKDGNVKVEYAAMIMAKYGNITEALRLNPLELAAALES